MKKLNNVLMAIVALFAFASVDARCRKNRCKPCDPAPAKCEPAKCHRTVRCEKFKMPCKKWVLQNGECEHTRTITCDTCESSKCTGPCMTTCEPDPVSTDEMSPENN